MEFKHRFIDGSRYQRIFVIGDIHGKLVLLQDTLKRVDFHGERDLLISVGDLIDRGPDSVGVLDYYQTHHWFEAVMGNHEWMMVNALDAQNKLEHSEKEAYFIKIWHRNGCEWSQNLTDAEKQRLRNAVAQLPSVITVELEDGRRFGISHAQPHSLDWNEMIDWQGDMWDNPRWIWGRTRIAEEEPQAIANVDLTLHGHTRSEGVKRVANSLFIDTASNDDYQGAFSLYELRTGEVFVGVKQSVLV
ncbi:TPA: metallophosphoesterase [Vibrio vulnificus]|uniref:metallophosphoesterase n=1 Tax=Vibrio vulnificus TaxID=672 RepID=UPI000CD2055B|nr:metallophosphoesterase [Vibrio vulnificus]POB17249.1 diadenosine tetraphosphatase [Vibrio vulnificus]HAS6019696.1 diadenosine tetraphosphatase [Vibrio vulnificus]HAS6173102.1 diadenosine tetraphosphatase [Vibrio vulnificus]HAS6351511.1 diadenosine tetraphosphatase [Vibrio vulnificus]HAS6365412.1 diadenosine tetraphosphatase [Vibrio vulnificus]